MIHDAKTIRLARRGLERGLTYVQIAALLGVTKGVVAGIVHRRVRKYGPDQAGRRLLDGAVAREMILERLSSGDTLADAARSAKVSPKTGRRIRDRLVAEGRLTAEQGRVRSAIVPVVRIVPPSDSRRASVAFGKTSALLAFRSIQPVSTARQIRPKPTTISVWDEATQRRLVATVAASSSLQEVADKMGMSVLGVGTRMSRTGLKLTTALTWTERDAVDRLHGEGVTPRRIAVRVGVPLRLVDERITQIKDGIAIRIWIDGPRSGTRSADDGGKSGGSPPQDVGKAATE